MIRRLYEAVSGRPWTTTRSAVAEFGPPPGAVYATQLAAYRDAELYARPVADVLADIRREVNGMGRRDEQARRVQERQMEEKVLAKAGRLDPGDQSLEARLVREVADQLREHHSSPR